MVTKVLALCPSRERPRQAAETLASFKRTIRLESSRLVFLVDDDDPTLAEYPSEHTQVVPSGGCMGAALAKADFGDATAVGMVGDDNRFASKGWDRSIGNWLTENVGIAYANDGHWGEKLPTSWWLSRPIVDEFGMAHSKLRHLFMDNYWLEMGRGAGCLRYFDKYLIDHLHPLFGKGPDDASYHRAGGMGSESPNIAHDRNVFEAWKRNDMARDVRRLKHLIANRPVNVLADYHHPALYESLALTFEDRFGWRLFRPVGKEWKTAGIWSFTNLNMGLDWFDFLAVDKPGRPAEGYALLDNPQYPERPSKGVTLEQAKAMDWGYVVASVWQNQHGFERFAREQGAVFVHQIGNAKHNVDMNLDARYLLSSNIDLGDKPALTYHQEFDTWMFRYEPPPWRKRIANFSCRFSWVRDNYAMFNEAKALRPDIEWHDYGTLHGELVRQSDVADAMRACSFIWHDKPMGDGYGHVIHNAASVGRPLIGHASYYKGRLAEPFWRDGETCIDLDRHSVPEAMALVREILGEPARHRAMCEAMARTFHETVDFGMESCRVKALLERKGGAQ